MIIIVLFSKRKANGIRLLHHAQLTPYIPKIRSRMITFSEIYFLYWLTRYHIMASDWVAAVLP